jgi:predicted phosphoribosyltransferase
MRLFADRVEAGQKLAQELKNISKDALVLAIPRGGVVVGAQIAQAHQIPLDVIVTKKIGAPGNPELAIGAVAEDGTFLADQGIIQMLNVSQDYIDDEVHRQKIEIERRIKHYRSQPHHPH